MENDVYERIYFLQLLKEKWLSVQNHIVNVHQWAGNDMFHQCSHPPLTNEQKRSTAWLKKGSKAHKAICSVVSNDRLLSDLKKMTKFKHTGMTIIYIYI